jgi:hypothetical protein
VPVPYILCFLSRGGIVVQFQVPLCIRDADLDARQPLSIEREFPAGDGVPYERTRSWVIPLVRNGMPL